MYKITYDITDAKGVNYKGIFVTGRTTPQYITAKILDKHPEIYVPFKSQYVKVNKI